MVADLAYYEGNVNIGGILIVNIRFAFEIAGITREKSELKGLVERLGRNNKSCKMKTGPEKTQVMTSNPGELELDIREKAQCMKQERVLNNKDLSYLMAAPNQTRAAKDGSDNLALAR